MLEKMLATISLLRCITYGKVSFAVGPPGKGDQIFQICLNKVLAIVGPFKGVLGLGSAWNRSGMKF